MCYLCVLGQVSFSYPQSPSLKFWEGNSCNSMRTNGVGKCLLLYLLVSVTNICHTVLPIFPFFLFVPGTFLVIYSMWFLWGWLCFCSGIEVDNWTRPGVLEYPISLAMVTFQSCAHNPSQPLRLTCWDLVRVTKQNFLLGVGRGWDVIWGQLAAILPANSKAPSPEIVRATRSVYASWAQLTGYKAQQEQVEPRTGTDGALEMSSGSPDLSQSEAECRWAGCFYLHKVIPF